MGFIDSASTVTVTAKLTDAGKKKLYESIESDSSGFITKFAVGDSDSNYGAIDLGSGPLDTGHVPEVSDFKPSIRSHALYQGTFRPGIPVVLVNDEYGSDNGVTTSLSIGANEQVQLAFELKTEWPKNEAFSEIYKVDLQNPGNISESQLNSLFTVVSNVMVGSVFQFNGNATAEELLLLIGADGSGNSTTIPIRIIGKTTNAKIIFNIELVQ